MKADGLQPGRSGVNMSWPHHVDGDGLRDAGPDEDRGGLEWPHWVVDQAVVAPLLGCVPSIGSV